MSLKRLAALLVLPLAALAFQACGGVLGNADGAAKLTIRNVTMKDPVTGTDGSARLLFFPHEAVFDTGCDQLWGNNSPDGERNFFPDSCEQIVSGFAITNDPVTIEVLNTPRLGVKEPVDIIVYRVEFTYFDKYMRARSFMPKSVQNVSVQVAPEESIKFAVNALPATYKTAVGGLRDIFLYGNSQDNMYGDVLAAEVDAASSWTVYIDIDALDPENGDTIHSQAVVTYTLQNPIPLLGQQAPET